MTNLWTKRLLVLVFSVVACAESPSLLPKNSKTIKTTKTRTGLERESTRPRQIDDQTQLARWIKSFVAKVAPVARQLNLAYWKTSTGLNPDASEEVSRLEKYIRILYSNKSRFKWLRQLSKKNSIYSPVIKRQLHVLQLEFEENQASRSVLSELVQQSASLEKSYASIRAMLDGKAVSDNDIYQILAEQRDPVLRHKAWNAYLAKGDRVSPAFLKLLRTRNRAARAVGARDYFQLRLRMDEVDENTLMTMTELLSKLTDAPFGRLMSRVRSCLSKRYGIDPEQVAPWHMDDPFFQRLPSCAALEMSFLFEDAQPVALAQRTYALLGVDLAGVLSRSDLLERPGKLPGAFCLDLDRGSNVRVFANVRPGKSWTSTMLHELGHAAYLLGVDKDLPWTLRRPACDSMSEAIAMLGADLMYEPAWLEQILGLGADRLNIKKDEILASRRDQLLLSIRFYLLMVNFEQELYANPEQDLSALWWRLAKRYQGLIFPEGQRPESWPFIVHLLQAPVYFHNYLMGRLMASQLRARLTPAGRSWFSKAFWDKLQKRIFFKGALYHWDKILKTATGDTLDPSFFLDEILPKFQGEKDKDPKEAK